MNALTLADLLSPEIIVNTVNPGLCHSGLLRESDGIKGCLLTYVMTTLVPLNKNS